MRAPLDPRFALVMERMGSAHPDALNTMHQHATMFARNCGRTYEQALAEHYGLAQSPGLPQEPVSATTPPPSHLELPETPPTSQFPALGPVAERVATLLRADPSRSNRDVAREAECSPTIVRRTRERLGMSGRTDA